MVTAEVHPFAQKLCRILKLGFSFPSRGLAAKRHMLLDIPEVLLVASLVVATKQQYPLDGVERFPLDDDDPLCLQMDWTLWESEFTKEPEKKPVILHYENMDPQQVWSMGKDEMAELLDWFQETQIDKRPTGESDIRFLAAGTRLTNNRRNRGGSSLPAPRRRAPAKDSRGLPGGHRGKGKEGAGRHARRQPADRFCGHGAAQAAGV